MLQKVIVKVSQQDGVGHCFDKKTICSENTEKCQILKKFFTDFFCWICCLTKVVSTQYTTVPFSKSPIGILRDVQESGCWSANTAGLPVTAPV